MEKLQNTFWSLACTSLLFTEPGAPTGGRDVVKNTVKKKDKHLRDLAKLFILHILIYYNYLLYVPTKNHQGNKDVCKIHSLFRK